MKKKESVENYLETILVLKSEMEHVRSIDIVNRMGFTKPSVSVAMKKLRASGMVIVDENGYLELTSAGKKLAESVYERHTVLKNALISMGVPEDIAREDACRMEHDLSDITFEKIKEHIASHQKGK